MSGQTYLEWIIVESDAGLSGCPHHDGDITSEGFGGEVRPVFHGAERHVVSEVVLWGYGRHPGICVDVLVTSRLVSRVVLHHQTPLCNIYMAVMYIVYYVPCGQP